MTIQILTFGIARDITGASALKIDLSEGATVADLQAVLWEQFPAFARLSSLMIAVNAAYSSEQTVLRESDEVALIPPVSGG